MKKLLLILAAVLLFALGTAGAENAPVTVTDMMGREITRHPDCGADGCGLRDSVCAGL